MTLLLALALLGSAAKAVEIEVPPVPAAAPIRLVVEVVPDARGWAMLTQEQDAALKTAVEASAGAARLINADGPSGIFDARAFIEVKPQAAAALKAALAPTGLKVASLEAALQAFHQAAPAQLPQDDASLKAFLDRMMDGSRPLEARSADYGALVQALSANPHALNGRSEESRREVSRALYNGSVPLLDAFNAVRGDQRRSARKAWAAAHPGSTAWQDRELSVHAQLQKPEKKAPVEPIRAMVRQAGRALQASGSDASVPLLLTLLPHADYAIQEDLSRRPNAARRLVKDYLAMMEKNIVLTRDLALELATSPDAKNEDIRMPTHSGGISSLDVPKVSGHRAAVWAYRVSAWFFDLGDMPHTLIALLGSSPSAAAELQAGLPALISRAGPLIAETSAALRSVEEARIIKSFDRMAGKFLEDPSLKPQLDQMRRAHLDEDLKRWDEYNTVEGHEVLDRAVRTLGWYGVYDHLAPAFDEDAYITNVSAILRAATATAGLGMFKLVAQCSLRFVEEVRRHAWGRLLGTTKDEVDAVESAVRARALARDLKLLP